MLRLKDISPKNGEFVLTTDPYITLDIKYSKVINTTNWYFIRGERSILEIMVEENTGLVKEITMVILPPRELIHYDRKIADNYSNKDGVPSFEIVGQLSNNIFEENIEFEISILTNSVIIFWSFNCIKYVVESEGISFYIDENELLKGIEIPLGSERDEVLKNITNKLIAQENT